MNKEIVFSGSYHEIGKQLGKHYKNLGKTYDLSGFDRKLFNKQYRCYKRYYPQILEEAEGVASGGDYNSLPVIYSYVTSERNWYLRKIHRNGCTIFGVKNKNGEVFVGRNYDWYRSSPIVRYRYNSNTSFKYLAISDINYYPKFQIKDTSYYVDDALNEAGLYVGITFAYSCQVSFGISSTHMARLIAEKCVSVKDAVKLFNQIPVCCPKNFFIADKRGNMVVIEHLGGKKFHVVRSKNNCLIKTNHYVSSTFLNDDIVLQESPKTTSFLRYYEVLRSLNTKGVKNITQMDIQKILLNKIYQTNPDFSTIWSLILNMKKGQYTLYSGGSKIKTNRIKV